MKPSQINKLRQSAEPYRGVSLDITKVRKNSNQIFRARIAVNGERYSLGYHTTPEDAAKAINKKAKMLFRTEKNAKKAGYWNVIA